MSIMTGIIYFLAGWKAIEIVLSTGRELYIAIKLYINWKRDKKVVDKVKNK